MMLNVPCKQQNAMFDQLTMDKEIVQPIVKTTHKASRVNLVITISGKGKWKNESL
jgi:hypothetical protein